MTINELGKRIGFVGGGNMAEAFILGLLDAGICLASDVCVSDIRKKRLTYMNESFAVHVAGTNRECVERSDLIVLAVKPQNIAGLLEELSELPFEGKIVLSIVAGARTERIEQRLTAGTAVARAMPNTPALIGEAMSVWTRGKHVTDKDAESTRFILAALGKEIEVQEDLMNAATALAGSGPAYVFYLLEAMVMAGVRMGFSAEQATFMAVQTVIGAGKLVETSGRSPAELRSRVTSPGGTTAAALRVLDSSKVKRAIVQAISEAHKRADELSKEP